MITYVCCPANRATHSAGNRFAQQNSVIKCLRIGATESTGRKKGQHGGWLPFSYLRGSGLFRRQAATPSSNLVCGIALEQLAHVYLDAERECVQGIVNAAVIGNFKIEALRRAEIQCLGKAFVASDVR
jgi:hypothetical protein